MTRTLAVLLLACGAVVAAPVPKVALKLADVFGEVANPKGECKFEMGRDGALRVTVPTTHPTLEPSTGSTSPPMVGKKLDGDFVLTARVARSVPKKAEGKGFTYRPAAFAGVSVVAADDSTLGLTAGVVQRREGDEWAGSVFASSRRPGHCIGGNYAVPGDPAAKPDAAVYLRVTRRADKLEVEASDDGKAWERVMTETVSGMTGAVTVGPVAFGCIDQEFTATFDQYVIKQAEEKK